MTNTKNILNINPNQTHVSVRCVSLSKICRLPPFKDSKNHSILFVSYNLL